MKRQRHRFKLLCISLILGSLLEGAAAAAQSQPCLPQLTSWGNDLYLITEDSWYIWGEELPYQTEWGESSWWEPVRFSTPEAQYLVGDPLNVYLLDRAGQLWGWGSDGDGQLRSDGTSVSWNDPAQILDNVIMMDALGEMNGAGGIALRTDGSVWTWGSWKAPLGIPGRGPGGQTQYPPTPIMEDIVWIDGSTGSSLAVDRSGGLWSWESPVAGGASRYETPEKCMDGVWRAMDGGTAGRWLIGTEDRVLWLLSPNTSEDGVPWRCIMDEVLWFGEGLAIRRDKSLWLWDEAGIFEPVKVMDGTEAAVIMGKNYPERYLIVLGEDGTLWRFGPYSSTAEAVPHLPGPEPMLEGLSTAHLETEAEKLPAPDLDRDPPVLLRTDTAPAGPEDHPEPAEEPRQQLFVWIFAVSSAAAAVLLWIFRMRNTGS